MNTQNTQAKFDRFRKLLKDHLIEREEEIDLALTALLCQEHLLLVGPPGTAKSLLLDSLMRWLGGNTFSILLTKFTTPEEVFGPISVIGLKADQYYRITAGKAPEAHGLFIDEIFKASSAILNTLLKLINERTFDDGRGIQKKPLKICVAASNEWPSGEGRQELGALYDRFLFRRHVSPIRSRDGKQRLKRSFQDFEHLVNEKLEPSELHAAFLEVSRMPWTDEAKQADDEIDTELAKEGIIPGDRRRRKSVLACQAFAWLNGAHRVEPDHLEILGHTLWEDPEEQPEKAMRIIAKIANPVGAQVSSLLMEVEGILAECDIKDLSQAASATAKLSEIGKKLSKIPKTPSGNGRIQKAQDYVRSKVKEIKLATVEAF